MTSLFLWKESDELNYHRIHTQYLLELFKYVQNKPLVIYVDTNEINLQNGIDYYNGKHINIQDFYKNANESWELVKENSPVFLKHMKWFDSYIENKTISNNNYRKRHYKIK